MKQLLRIFFDIAILRRGPQDLPASHTLVWLVSAAYLMVSAVQSMMRGWDASTTLVLLVLDIGMQAVWLWALLVFFAKRSRFLQTFSAFMGVNALLTVMDIAVTAVQALLGMATTDVANPWHMVSLCIMLLTLGRILQQALERGSFLCMALTLVIMVTIAFAAQVIVPGL